MNELRYTSSSRTTKRLLLVELDYRQARECELVFFGVIEKAIGTGAGRWMMNRTIQRAWSTPIRRFWVTRA
jgi:hypothetical protein